MVLALLLSPSAAHAAFGDRTLRSGHEGHDVRVLQSWLTHLGYRTTVDGAYGPGTIRSVKRYERAERLPRDGRVSPAQARRMRRQVERGSGRRSDANVRFGERDLARGARGRDVRVLQSWLGHLGLPTEVDGVFGAGTERNVKRYEGINDLPTDGELTRPEAARMRAQVEGGEAMPEKAPADGDHVFPVDGRYRFGDRFGADRGGRRHQGQDVFASCGTPLVAAQGGKVVYSGFHSAAGHYVVVRGSKSREDYVYMHLRRAALARTGQTVSTGERLGDVGESGNAQGCHLHFELWTAPGWYEGGRAYDPRPALDSWAR